MRIARPATAGANKQASKHGPLEALRCATPPSSEGEVEQPSYWAGNYLLDDLIYPAGEADGGEGAST
jgi:hypothetical protein